MGNLWQRLHRHHDKEVRILMVGLDAAGKTTALYMLKLGEAISTAPTVGFNIEKVHYKGSKFSTWDISGIDKTRPLWRHYFQGADILIFVIDSSDRERISESKYELWRCLGEDELKNVTLLVMANKQDLPNAMSVEEISQKLEVEKIQGRKIHVQGTCATSGDGLYEGLSWIQTTLAQKELNKSASKEVLALPEGKAKSH